MSRPENPPSSSPPEYIPSSFDDNPEFFEEKRLGKLWRRLKEEPLIPVGCLATCYALYQATKSVRQGDHHQTNRMFRARIYAQGFTLMALVAGSIFYKDERLKRKRFEAAVEEKKAAEKREKWLRELEARDRDDREWRERFEGVAQRAKEAEEAARGEAARAKEIVEENMRTEESIKDAVEERFRNKSVLEEVTWSGWGPGTWVTRTRRAWQRI